jgi:diguanylate cyclase
MRESPIVLIIDDEPDNFDVVEALLHNEPYFLSYLPSGEAALNLIDKIQPDVILLDFMMPEITGIEVCRRIKSTPQWQAVPVIMLTALNSKEDLSRCLDAGADDFISKPIDALELRARIRSALRTYQQYQRIQELNQQLSQFNTVLEERVQQRTVELEDIIKYDLLTKLPSRFSLIKEISSTFNQHSFEQFVLITLDCDQFKLVNSSLGYDLGNKLLIAIAQRLSLLIKPEDRLARLGGDEFCLLLRSVPIFSTERFIVDHLLASFNTPFFLDGIEVYVTASCGITIINTNQKSPQELLQEADIAMHRAKQHGKGSYKFFDAQMQNAALKRLHLEQDMQRALKNREFSVYYQPILSLPERKVVGFEALARWHSRTQGFVSPSDFIPCAEETGLIVPLGLLVLRQACDAIQHWKDQFCQNLFMSVNLSVRQFSHPTLLDDIDQVLGDIAIAPRSLRLEITESAIVENPKTAINLIQELQSRQIKISIDDFGTGYSSLAYLSQFPVNNLKIDRFFISQMGNDQDSKIVEAVINLGHALDMSIVAEGIETVEQLERLEALGCDFGQGYFFSKPLPFADLDQYLNTQRFD